MGNQVKRVAVCADVKQLNSCVQLGKPLEDFPGPNGWTSDEQYGSNVANRLTVICMELPNIRVRAEAIIEKSQDVVHWDEIESIVETTRRIDAELEHWHQTLPSNWAPKTHSMHYDLAADLYNAEQWPGPIHVYEDVFIANILNDYRVSRIFCQSVILTGLCWLTAARRRQKYLDPGSEDEPFEPLSDHQALFDQALYVTQTLVDEICWCVPFHLRYDLQPQISHTGQDPGAAEGLGGYFLIWPVFICASLPWIHPKQREWLNGRLFHIGREFNLSQAQVLVVAKRHVLTCGPAFSAKAEPDGAVELLKNARRHSVIDVEDSVWDFETGSAPHGAGPRIRW